MIPPRNGPISTQREKKEKYKSRDDYKMFQGLSIPNHQEMEGIQYGEHLNLLS